MSQRARRGSLRGAKPALRQAIYLRKLPRDPIMQIFESANGDRTATQDIRASEGGRTRTLPRPALAGPSAWAKWESSFRPQHQLIDAVPGPEPVQCQNAGIIQLSSMPKNTTSQTMKNARCRLRLSPGRPGLPTGMDGPAPPW